MVEAHGSKTARGKPLFTFTVVADTHIQSPHDKPSPWKTNNLAAERSKLAYKQMATSTSPFIVHLGDVTNPVPHAPTFDTACEAALEVMKEAGMKTHIVAGNHDVGDKISRIVPNHPIDEFSIGKFEQYWGSSWSSWNHNDIHFVVINSSLVGSGLPQEETQLTFLEQDLEAHAGKRTFLFSHYPLFMESPVEPSLYDNIEPGGRTVLLDLIKKYSVEAAIAGHVHNFFYNTYEKTEMYGLLSTTFIRHDYAEMFPAAPADEYGRNDTPKLGWAEITVYETGHVLRTNRLLDPLRKAENTLAARQVDLHPKRFTRSGLGANLRQAWAEAKPLMYYGPVDEFERRKVRNDYLLLALWEAGIRHLRVPLRDLTRPEYVARMQAMVDIGHTFTAFCVDVPEGELLQQLLANEHLLAGLEIIIPWLEVDAQVSKLENLVNKTTVSVYLACISAAIDHRKKPYQFAYFMSYGFYADEIDILTEVHNSFGRRLGLGYAFRIGPTESPVIAGTKIIQDFVLKENVAATFNIASFSTMPGVRDDEVAATTRSLEAALLGLVNSGEKTKIFLETLVDVNTGYNPSVGLYDALHNPRTGAKVVSNLHAVICGGQDDGNNNFTVQSVENIEDSIVQFDVSYGAKHITIASPVSLKATETFKAKILAAQKSVIDLTSLGEVSADTAPNGPVILI